jgi:hypothetical protein
MTCESGKKRLIRVDQKHEAASGTVAPKNLVAHRDRMRNSASLRESPSSPDISKWEERCA